MIKRLFSVIGNIGIIILGIGLVGLALFLAGLFLKIGMDELHDVGTRTTITTGIIESITTDRDCTQTRNASFVCVGIANVVYSYSVPSVNERQQDFDKRTFTIVSSASRYAKAHPEGSPIKVYYDPDHPQDSLIFPSEHWFGVGVMFFFALVFLNAIIIPLTPEKVKVKIGGIFKRK